MTIKAILGIDQGTTGTCSAIVAADGRILARSHMRHKQYYPDPGWVEHDPIEIWNCTKKTILDSLDGLHGRVEIRGIGIANQGETVMLWDRVTGQPLHRAIVWQDTRTQETMVRLARDESLAKHVTQQTGLRLDAYFSASKIQWLLDHVPAARDLENDGRLCAGTLDAWLLFNLTGGRRFVTDHSTAARTLLFNIHTLSYDDEMLDLFGVPIEILPEVRDTTGDFGEVEGIRQDIDNTPIVTSMVDQPASTFAHGCLDPGSMKATYGTGCFLYMNTGNSPITSKHGLLTTICWRVNQQTTYGLDGGVFAAGSVVNWMQDGIHLLTDLADLDRLTSETNDSGGVVCVPSLTGLAAPYWNRTARGAWLGMGLDTRKSHLVRAALDGIAARVVQVVRAMEDDHGCQIENLHVDGGLTASSYMMQTQADLLGIPVEVRDDPEATVLGVSLLAAKHLGILEENHSTGHDDAKTFEPRLSSGERNARMERFNEATELVRAFQNHGICDE